MNAWLNDEDFTDLLEFGTDEDVFTAYAQDKLINQNMPHRVYMARKPLVELVIRYRVAMQEMNGTTDLRYSHYVNRGRLHYQALIRIQDDSTKIADVIPLMKLEDAANYIDQFIKTGRVQVHDSSTQMEHDRKPAMIAVYMAHSIYRANGVIEEDMDDLRENVKFYIHQYREE